MKQIPNETIYTVQISHDEARMITNLLNNEYQEFKKLCAGDASLESTVDKVRMLRREFASLVGIHYGD